MHHLPAKARPESLVLVVLLLLAALVPAHLVLRSQASVGDAPLVDDAYYAFSVARNIALGHGVTIDGETWTNGFQPLFTMLQVPAFVLAGADKYLPIRFVLALSWLCYLGTAYLLGRIAADSCTRQEQSAAPPLFITTALVYLTSVIVFTQHFNGLETGFLLLLYSATWRYYQLGYAATWRGLAGLGVLAGLIVLARIDAVFFVIVLAGYLLLSGGGQSFTARLARPALVAGVAFVVSLPWWLYNLIGFGSLMPSSGTAQQEWSITVERFVAALEALAAVALPVLPLNYMDALSGSTLSLLVQVGVILGVLLLIGWHQRQIRASLAVCWRDDMRFRRTLAFAGCLLLAGLALVAWYSLSSFATYFYSRYFAPFLLLSTVGTGMLLALAYRRYPRMAAAVIVVLALPIFTLAVFRTLGVFVAGDPHYNEQLPLVMEYVPEGEVVAAHESGTIGYFRDNVVNLDGKVNPEVLELGAQEIFGDYLEQRQARWFSGLVLPPTHPLRQTWQVVEEREHYGLYYIREYLSLKTTDTH